MAQIETGLSISPTEALDLAKEVRRQYDIAQKLQPSPAIEEALEVLSTCFNRMIKEIPGANVDTIDRQVTSSASAFQQQLKQGSMLFSANTKDSSIDDDAKAESEMKPK